MSQSLAGGFLSSRQRLEARIKVGEGQGKVMELSPREVAFVKAEMQNVEEDDTRQPTAQVEAGRIREKAESTLTE